jgi:hypothetical protein
MRWKGVEGEMRLCGLTVYLGQGQAQRVCESMQANAARRTFLKLQVSLTPFLGYRLGRLRSVHEPELKTDFGE